MAGWARGRLITLPGIRHEALMEAAALRMARVDEITEFFAQNTKHSQKNHARNF